MVPISRQTVVSIGATVASQAMWVKANVSETINLETGASTTQVTIDQLALIKDGQLIHPRTLTADEFRDLVTKIRRHEQYL